MRERLRIFLSLTAYWLSFMILARVIFMAYNYDYTGHLTWYERVLTLLHGLRMDASIAGYFLALAGLLLTISAVYNSIWLSRLLSFTTVSLLLICSFLVTADLELYRHWGFRLNTTPILYISKEALGSVEPTVIVKLAVLFAALFGCFLFVYLRRIRPLIMYVGETRTRTAIPLLLLTASMFLPIRGSFTVAPMNTGFVYFHKTKQFANHSAINVVWNFMYHARKASSAEYPVNFFDKKSTEILFSQLYDVPDSTQRIIDHPQPNIILIILESFTAGVVEPLGGKEGIAPHLNALCREGILFDQCYSSGDRTDKGLISILSGYPAQPRTSIIKFPAKTQRLPQLNQHLKKLGYRTSFIYGGDIDFANFRSYLNTSGFDQLTMLDDFDSDLYTSKWGVHDHHMFRRAMEELDTTQGPFFKVILTLSSHEPFDVPMEPFIVGTDPESLFLNSCHYTDRSLGTFIDHCKSNPWWPNTLVIITADHGHRHPGNKTLQDKERFHIPLLFTGGAVTRHGVNHLIGNQTDIANTLLAQLYRASPDFLFSKNLFNVHAKPFSAYFFNDGYGFITPESFVVYDNEAKRFVATDNAGDLVLDASKAYQQKLFTHYNNIDK